MKYLAILLVSVIYLVNAENGHYVPRSVYFIDENGNPSVPHPINSNLLNRVRRQVQQPFGGFAFPQPIFNFPQIQPGQGQGTYTSTSQVLSSRFGEDEPVVTGQTQTFHQSGNKFQQTTTVLRPDGSVQTNKQTGKTKRDTATQLQSQGHEDGKMQLQSQSQGPQGGTQFQSQSQPGMNQVQSQGSGPIQQPYPISEDRSQIEGRIPPQQNQQGNHGQQPINQGQQPVHQPINQGSQQNYPQGQPNYPQGQPNYPQGQPNYPQGQPNYPQGQPGYQMPGFGAFPFGFGGFQQPFGFPQQPGFPFAPGFPQFAGPIQPIQPAFGQGGVSSLDNRFGEDEVPTGVVGGTQTFTSQNGVYHQTSSVLKPNGQVETTHQHGKFPAKNN